MKEGKKKKTTINHPQEKKKKQHKNKALQDTEADGACQHLLQQEKKRVYNGGAETSLIIET